MYTMSFLPQYVQSLLQVLHVMLLVVLLLSGHVVDSCLGALGAALAVVSRASHNNVLVDVAGAAGLVTTLGLYGNVSVR